MRDVYWDVFFENGHLTGLTPPPGEAKDFSDVETLSNERIRAVILAWCVPEQVDFHIQQNRWRPGMPP